MTCRCGKPIPPCEAAVYGSRCEDCWVQGHQGLPPAGLYVRSGSKKRRDDRGGWIETGFRFRIGARTPK